MRAPRFVLGTARRDLRRTHGAGVGGILLMALTVVLWGGTSRALAVWDGLVLAWREELRIVAVLRAEPVEGESPGEVLVARARTLRGVDAVQYVSPAAALADLSRYLGAAATGIERLPANPVPARLVVDPRQDIGAEALQALAEELAGLPGVETVEAALAWVAPAERVRRALGIAGYGLAAVVGVATAIVIGGATRLAAEGRRTETAVLRLFGVPEARVRGPLVLQAVIQGSAGALLGVAVLMLGAAAGPSWAPGWLPTDVELVLARGLPWSSVTGLVSTGGLVGLAGGLGAGRS